MDLFTVRQEIAAEIRQLTKAFKALGGIGPPNGSRTGNREIRGPRVMRPRRTMSAAARKKIAAAQRARWARFHEERKEKKAKKAA